MMKKSCHSQRGLDQLLPQEAAKQRDPRHQVGRALKRRLRDSLGDPQSTQNCKICPKKAKSVGEKTKTDKKIATVKCQRTSSNSNPCLSSQNGFTTDLCNVHRTLNGLRKDLVSIILPAKFAAHHGL